MSMSSGIAPALRGGAMSMTSSTAKRRALAVDALRICLLSYRGNPRSGGQGIYVRLLSKALLELGHSVDVWSGQPYPELVDGVGLHRLPSLDLWNEQALFRTPTLRELWDPINLGEWARTRTGSFAEPITFSQRVARRFKQGGDAARYDVVHDNQCLGPGLLELQQRLPVVATVHHPITVDRRLAVQDTSDAIKRWGLSRWYSFLPWQLKVSRRLDRILAVSEASLRDVAHEYGVSRARMRVVGNGINLDVFRPIPGTARRADRLITTLSADTPLKGFRFLLEALHELRKRRPGVHLVVVGQPGLKTDTEATIRTLALRDAVQFTGYVEANAIARYYAESTIAVVPSLYEGFGFPAGEAMACEVPVVSTRAGALPEVVGEDGTAGLLVPPRDSRTLARAIEQLLDRPEQRAAMGEAGRRRVLEHFTWKRAAERTVAVYREAIEERQRAAHWNARPARTAAAVRAAGADRRQAC
jgi:glycosyltransferase involved in cell wall biosynthesis